MLDRKRQSVTGLLLLIVTSLLPGVAAAEISVARGSSSAAPAQQSESAPEWVYTLRSGETLSDIGQSLLMDRVTIGQVLQYNNLPGNARLSAGEQIRIPLAWLKRQPEPARVSSASGNVMHVSGTTGQKTPLTENSVIRVGDEVISSAGTATIVLADGSEL
ncbi:LysM peptidoglycan-binding domain-containing protein, partial [Marinobacter sp.]